MDSNVQCLLPQLVWRHLKGQQGDWDEKAVSGSSPNQNGQADVCPPLLFSWILTPG